MSNRPTEQSFADNPKLRSFFEKQGMNSPLVRRFVAGTTIRDALLVGKDYNDQNLLCAFDLLGEHVVLAEDAERSTQAYLDLIRQISIFSGSSYISLKLTALGLDISEETARQNLQRLCDEARIRGGVFIRVDMESSAYTTRTLQIVCAQHRTYPNIGTVVQSYLRRTDKDLQLLIKENVSIRLVKGAYSEPELVAFQRKIDIESAFRKQMYLLLEQGHHPAIGTHDQEIIKAAKNFLKLHNIPPDRYEFEMLHGIRRDLQDSLAKEGHKVRVYVPFGAAWYPYFSRRLAERPANVGFALSHLFR